MSIPADPPEGGNHTAATRTAVTRRTAELVVGVLLAAFGTLVVVSNLGIGAGWAEDGPQSGYFPFRMGLFILIASLAVIVQAILKNDRSAFVETGQLRQVAMVFLPLLLYVGALQLLGIYVASTLFIALFMIFVGRFKWWKAAGLAAAINLLLFWVFEVQFLVPLPKGPLERLLGY